MKTLTNLEHLNFFYKKYFKNNHECTLFFSRKNTLFAAWPTLKWIPVIFIWFFDLRQSWEIVRFPSDFLKTSKNRKSPTFSSMWTKIWDLNDIFGNARKYSWIDDKILVSVSLTLNLKVKSQAFSQFHQHLTRSVSPKKTKTNIKFTFSKKLLVKG